MIDAIMPLLTAVIIATITQVASSGTFTEYTDKASWQGAVRQWMTIGFHDLLPGTIVTTQYSNLGAIFSDGDDSINTTNSFLQDGYGLRGSFGFNPHDTITVEFDSDIYAIGIDYPGTLQIELYSLGQLIHTTEIYGGGEGNFLGVVSTLSFNRARITDPFNFVYIDDLHFGGVPAPGALPLLVAMLLQSRRRR